MAAVGRQMPTGSLHVDPSCLSPPSPLICLLSAPLPLPPTNAHQPPKGSFGGRPGLTSLRDKAFWPAASQGEPWEFIPLEGGVIH